jgi:Asp-tRNA(Asn)/Glu-tRNA(Gln) amidotransferase A subunit family amidase
MLHTIGLIARKDCKADVDAEAVKLMKEAGAILIAVSNVPEVNKWYVIYCKSSLSFDSLFGCI